MPTATMEPKSVSAGNRSSSQNIRNISEAATTPPPQPKISHGEAFLLIAFAVMADVITLIPFINILAALLFGAFFQLYFYMKKVKGTVNLIGLVIEAVPFLSILPVMTITVVMVIAIDHNPKAKQVIERAQPKTSLKKAA